MPPNDLLADLRQHKAEIVAFFSHAAGWTAADTIKAGRQYDYITGKPEIATSRHSNAVNRNTHRGGPGRGGNERRSGRFFAPDDTTGNATSAARTPKTVTAV
jgi:hypothetical protein